MSDADELSRFTADRKTFFFNRRRAKNGKKYLSIDAIWGDGNRERVVVFPGQMAEFWQHVTNSVEEITGLRPAAGSVELEEGEETVTLPIEALTQVFPNPMNGKTGLALAPCNCDMSAGSGFTVRPHGFDPEEGRESITWVVACESCGDIVMED